MQQPNLRSELTRRIAISEPLPATNLPASPFIEARLLLERNIVAKASAFSGGLDAEFRPLRTPGINPQYAWAITFTKDEYWEKYIPTQGFRESDATYRSRVESSLAASPFFKWRHDNEVLKKNAKKPQSLATWFLTQPQAFIKQSHPLLFVLEVLRNATEQQIEEMAALYPNLLLPDALMDCPLFAKYALAYQDFKTLDEAHAVGIVFRSFEEHLLLQEFFNKHMLNLVPEILIAFLKDHADFAYQYFLAQQKDNLTPITLRCLLNTPALAPLNTELALNENSANAFEARKKSLALARLKLHEHNLITAFLEINAQAIANNIHIFANVVTRDLLLFLIKKDVDDITECLMRSYQLYEALFFGESNIIAELDLNKPHLAARFIQYIPVKKGLILTDAQLAALAKRTDEPTLLWLTNYFPSNTVVLSRLMLQERPLLEYVLSNPSEEIIRHLINDFPVNEVRSVTLLISAMTKLQKYFPLNKDQITKMLRLGDDGITNWLFKHESHLPAMQELLQDETLAAELRSNNPRFLAHTITEQNTSFESFFDLVLNNPKFVERMTAESPGLLQRYIAMAKKHLEQHINADPILTVLRTASVAIATTSDARIAPASKTARKDIMSEIDTVQKAVVAKNTSFNDLISEYRGKEGIEKLARLYVLYTFNNGKESVADKELKDTKEQKIRPAKIVLGELLINACMDVNTKNYDLLAVILRDREPLNKVAAKWIGKDEVTPINYLPAINGCFLSHLNKLASADLLELLANQALFTVAIKYYQNEIKTQLLQRAANDASFTLLLLSSPEMRLVLDKQVNIIGGFAPQPLLIPQEQQAILTHLCNRTENACTLFAANPSLLSWAYNKLPDRVKNMVVLGLDKKELTTETLLRTPEFIQIFTPDELLSRITPAQARASLHYRHILEMFNDETKLKKLLAKAQLSPQDLFQQLFKLETGNYHYLHTRALLRIINGEADVSFPKPPAPTATSRSVLLQREPSISAFKPYAEVQTPERTSTTPSAADAASISISSPLSSAAMLSRASGSDIARSSALSRTDSLNTGRTNSADIVVSSPLPPPSSQPRSGSDIVLPSAPLARVESFSAAPAAQKSPTGSVIANAAPTTPSRTSVDSSHNSPPPPPSLFTSPVASAVLTASPVDLATQTAAASSAPSLIISPASQTQVSELSSTSIPAAATDTEAKKSNAEAEKPAAPPSSQNSAAINVAGTNVDAASAAQVAPDTDNKGTLANIPAAPTTAAIKPPPPPPLKKPAATTPLPEGVPAPQPGRNDLLASLQTDNTKKLKKASERVLSNSAPKAAAKPAAKGPRLFDNSAAAAASSGNASLQKQSIDAELLAFIEAKIGSEKKKEIDTYVTPLIDAIRTADFFTYEKLVEQLTEKLSALTKSGLESTLALAMSARRNAMRPASTYGDESPVGENKDEWDEGESRHVAPPTTPTGSSIAKSSVDSKTSAIIAEVRRIYPCPAPSSKPPV